MKKESYLYVNTNSKKLITDLKCITKILTRQIGKKNTLSKKLLMTNADARAPGHDNHSVILQIFQCIFKHLSRYHLDKFK